MAATAIHRLTLDPMGKCSNAFFSETTKQKFVEVLPMIIPGQFGFNCPSGYVEVITSNVFTLQSGLG
jgi:hypothetical protein